MAVTDKEKKYPDWWYQSPYQKELDSLAGQIENRPDFKFKVDQEALYDYCKGEYDRQGQVAKLDTQAKAAGLTGGFDNSYARRAGQQAHEAQMAQLGQEVVPELWQMALDKYTREGEALVDRYEAVQKKEKAAYDQWEKEHKDEIEALQRQQEQQNAAASAVDRIVGKNNRNDPMAQYMSQRVDQITAGKTTKDPGQVAKDLSWEGYRTTMDSAIRKVTGHQDFYDSIPEAPQYADSPLYVQKPPTAEELAQGLVPYESLTKIPDFLEQSQYEPKAVGAHLTRPEMEGMTDEEQDRYFDAFNYESSQEDLLYEAVNGNFLAMLALNSNGYEIYEGLDEIYRKTPSELMQLTAQEISVFNYLYKTLGLDAAKRYLNYLASDLSGRQIEAVQAAAANRAQKQPFLSSVDTIITSPFRGQIGTVGVLSDLLEDGKLSTNADYNMLDYQANAVRGKVSEMIEKQTPFGKVGSFLYGAGMSIGDSLARMVASAGNPFLSAELAACSAGVSTISNAKNLGLNDAQALALGVIAGFAEGFFEKHNLEDLLNADLLKDGWKKYILKNATNEATEEVSTELVNTVADIIIGWDKGQMRKAIDAYKAQGLDAGQASLRAFCDKLLEIGEAGAMGFLTGGLMSGTNVALNSIVSTAYKKSGPTQAARQLYTGTDAPAVNTPGTELSEGSQGVDTDMGSPNAAWDQAVQRYVQEGQTAPVVTIRESRAAQSDTAKAENSSLKAASKKYGAQAAMMENAYREGQDVERYDQEYKLAYDMGKEGASRELMDGGAFAYLTAEQKNTAYQSGAAAAENAGIVAAAVKSLGITGENAGVLTQSFNANQITARNYAMGLQEAYEAGKTGIPLAQAGSHAAKLTDAQRQIAYKQGQKASGRQVAKQQAQVRKNRSAEGADTSKGKVHFEGDRSSLNKTQRASMDAMEVLAKTLGVQIYVENFEGTKNANKNGWYDPKDGSIHININAGADGKGTMLFAVAHELTHFIKQWSPAKFRVLANFLVKRYGEQGVPVSDLIDAQIADAKADNRDLTREEALEEVVADSMETMLVDGSIIEMMAEIRQQDHGLWAKIKEWFRDFASKLQAVVDAYKGVRPDSAEGRLVADMKDMIGTLQALYMDALVDASENFDGGVQKITTADSGGVKYSFAGERAKNADLEALEKAKEMRSAGVAGEIIRQQTGWYVGMDGKWRWEIDDSGMEYSSRGDFGLQERRPDYARYRELLDKANRHALELSDEALTHEEAAELQKLKDIWGGTFRTAGRITEDALQTELLSDYVKHDALFEAYPQLRKTRLRFADMPEGTRGRYDPEQDVITVSQKLRGKPQDTLVHEIQHAIQRAEGFTSGSSLEYWMTRLEKDRRQEVEIADKRYRDLFDSMPEGLKNRVRAYNRANLDYDYDEAIAIEEELLEGEYAELFSAWMDADFERRNLRERYKAADLTEDARANYRNTAGEIEARNASDRRTMTQERRKNTPPDLGDEDMVFADSTYVSTQAIGRTVDNKPFVTVATDVLSGVPKKDWVQTIKNNLRRKYPKGVVVGRNNIRIDAQSRKELTYSKYMQWLKATDPQAYADKLRATDNSDEILMATTDWINEGLNHPRKDKIVQFARGNLLLRVGQNDYTAKVVVATETNGKMKLYDILDLNKTQIVAKEMDAAITENPSPGAGRNTASISDDSVSQQRTEVNEKFVLYSDRDSAGNQLSAEQQEYFKDSEARDDGGNLLVLYHQTDGNFTIFDTRHPGAGTRDSGTPFGIFMKRSAGDIGLAGKKQMALYANITNPLRATNREDLARKLCEISERYASISDQHKKLDAEYREKFEQAKKAWVNYITEWRAANPGAGRNALNADPKFNELYDAEDNVVDEWTAAADRLSAQAKEAITEDLRKAGYDGVFLSEDVGSWGRKTDAIIALDPEQVKNITNKKPTQNPDIRYSQRDVGRQEAVTQALEKENAKLREDVAELRELVKLQRQVTNGTKFTKTSVEAAARYLKQNANAKGDTKGLMKLLNSLYEYIASTKELTWEGVKEQAQGAADWLWEHIDRQGKPTEYAQDILKQLHGARVYLDESQMAEAAYRFGSYDAFRKGLMGNITLAKNANTSLDSLWAEFSEMYPDVFDSEISAADMPSALMDVIHRLRSPDTTIDYARNREMMEQDLLREIYDSYWRVSTLYTPADVGARRINKLKSEHYQRMEKLKQQHRETIDRLKQEHRARLEQVRKDHRAKLEEKVDLVTKKYQDARKQNVEGRKKTEQRRKIRKTIRELSKLLTHGTKERNVKEGMKDFVSTAIASAEVLFTDEYTNEDMVRNGVECECEGWESSLIDKTRALIRQRDDLLAGAAVGTEVEDVIAGDTSGYEARMKEVRKLDGKISENMGKLKGVFARERSRLNKATASSLLNSLAEEYWKLGTADEEYIRGALDENVHQHLLNLSKEIGGTTVKDMSLSQLEQLHRAYTMVLTTVRNANKSFAENLKGTRQEQAKAVTGELAEAGKNRKKQTKGQIARAKRSWNNLKSVYAFERIGSGTLRQLYENLRGGEDTWMVDMDHARDYFLKAAKDGGYNGWDLNKQTYSFESSTGLEFDLNLGQIMSIYAYARRGEQALDHLMKGGFVFDKHTEERVTEHGIPKTYLKDDATAYNLSLATIQQIIGKLTPEQRAFVEKMQDYLSDTMGGKGNEVSMKLYGVKLFGEKFYFPLRSSGVYLSKAADQEMQKQQGQVSVKNAGFTHSTTPNAANPVVLSGFMDVWANHVNDMSMYHAFVLPMEDFNKVYNYSTPHTEEGQSGAVKQAIINAHGSAATDYINQFIRDLNGGVVADPREGQYKAWISKFKKASVMASASVVIQQPTAIVRALAYIDPKYFGAFSISRGIGRALGNKITGNHTQVYEELKKYAPVAAIKQMGRFDTDMGMGAVDYLTAKEFEGFKAQAKAIFTEKGYLGKRFDEITGFLAERADEITWAQIWQAVKKEVADKQGLKFGSEEHLQAAGKRFTEVITRTQVYDSVFSRSSNMRSKGAFMAMATSFMAEPTTTANMLTDAIRKAKRGDVKHFLRVSASVAGAIIFNNILRSAVYAMRDDDEDETFVEKYLQALTGGVFDDVNPMSYLPFWRDVWSLVQRYDVERADMSVIATLMDAAYSLADVMAKDTSGMTEEELAAHEKKKAQKGWSFADALASAVGLPMKNVRRDILGAVNFFATIKADGSRETTSGSLKDKVWEDFVSSVPGAKYVADLDSRTDDLYDAIVAGDNAYMERLKSGYKSEQSYLQAVRKGLRENDGRIRAAAVARMDGELESYMSIAKEIIAEGNFTQDDVVAAINAVINELTPSGSSSATKAKGLFDTNAFAVAISQDDTEMAKMIQADIVRTAQLNGKTEEEAEKSFISSVTSACKEMFGEGDLSEEQAVNALMDFCEKDEVEARASVAYWEFSMEYPDVGASAGWFETYCKKVENSGIAIEDYVEYRNRKTGYSKRAEVLKVIDGMSLTKAQKDALYRAEGYAESTLDEVPWH